MSLNLALLPIPLHCDSRSFAYSHEMLEVEEPFPSEIFDKIQALKQEPVPPDFSTFRAKSQDDDTEYGYGNTQETPYGEQLMMTTMGLLKTVGIFGPTGAYINACRDKQLVALYWR